MRPSLKAAVGISAIIAPALHLISDVMELMSDGFSKPQLLVNYVAFLMMPFVFIGLYAVQKPAAHWLALVGSLLYGASFVYFAHTTLRALEDSVTNYPALLATLGSVYYVHGGGLMIAGGLIFFAASLSAKRLSSTGLVLFACGLAINLVVAFVPVTEMLQISGSVFRNVGLIIIGVKLLAREHE